MENSSNVRKKGLWKSKLPISSVLVLKLSPISTILQLVRQPRYQKFVLMGDLLYYAFTVQSGCLLQILHNVNSFATWCALWLSCHISRSHSLGGFLGQERRKKSILFFAVVALITNFDTTVPWFYLWSFVKHKG